MLKPCLRAFRADRCFPRRDVGPLLILALRRLADVCLSLIDGRFQRVPERRLSSYQTAAAQIFPKHRLSHLQHAGTFVETFKGGRMPQEYVSIYDIEGVSFCCEAIQSTFIFPGWKRAVAKTVLRPALKFTHGERPAGENATATSRRNRCNSHCALM